MSGHSKWANIRRAKGKNDAERGKIFTKIGREIAVAAKLGGSDLNTNSRLRDAISKAKQNNMASDTITRNIKKGAGQLENVNYEEVIYEGYGTGGSAVVLKCLTDNKNRTVGDIRHIFDKFGGSLGSNGSVSYLFNIRGIIEVKKSDKMPEDDFILICIEAGAEDVIDDGDIYTVITLISDFAGVKTEIEKNNLEVQSAAIEYLPQNYLDLDSQQISSFLKMIDRLEDLDDVQDVYHNVNIKEEDIEE